MLLKYYPFSVIKQSLKNSPVWENLVSSVGDEVMKLFLDKHVTNATKQKPRQPEIVQLINKLISEYMDWMGYKLTNNMFLRGVFKTYTQLFLFD